MQDCINNGKRFYWNIEWLDSLGFEERREVKRVLGTTEDYITEKGENTSGDEYYFITQQIKSEDQMKAFKMRLKIFQKLYKPFNNFARVECYSKETVGQLFFSPLKELKRVKKSELVRQPLKYRVELYANLIAFLARVDKYGGVYTSLRTKNIYLGNGQPSLVVPVRWHAIYPSGAKVRFFGSKMRKNVFFQKIVDDYYQREKNADSPYVELQIEKVWSKLSLLGLMYDIEKNASTIGNYQGSHRKLLEYIQRLSKDSTLTQNLTYHEIATKLYEF